MCFNSIYIEIVVRDVPFVTEYILIICNVAICLFKYRKSVMGLLTKNTCTKKIYSSGIIFFFFSFSQNCISLRWGTNDDVNNLLKFVPEIIVLIFFYCCNCSWWILFVCELCWLLLWKTYKICEFVLGWWTKEKSQWALNSFSIWSYQP